MKNSFIKFCFVGFLNTGVDFGVFSLLTGLLAVNSSISHVISYIAGILNSFIWNRQWAFRNTALRGSKPSGQFVRFAAVNLVTLGITLLLLNVLLSSLGINKYISKGLVIAVSMVINFLGYRLWVFKISD